MRIFLIGFMGAGKTRLGRIIARRLDYDFVDMDHLIEAREGITVREIFSRKGEAGFRKLEGETLEELVRRDKLVVSTGGGVPCEPGNMDLIKRHGISIYLKMDPSDLLDRLKVRQYKRPLIKNLSEKELKEYIENKLAEREPYYRRANYTIDGLKPDVEQILSLLKD